VAPATEFRGGKKHERPALADQIVCKKWLD